MPELEYRRYMGGRALIGKFLLQETDTGVDPLSPGNPLIFAPGVLTGAPLAGSGRNAVGAKSPLTGGFGCSEGGGFFPAELRRTGIAALIVTGRAQRPSCIVIDGEQVRVEPAGELWGKTVDVTDRMLRERLGRGFRVAAIGPAGERMVRFASILNDVTHACGRTGMGAVMGSKNLKAVAAKAQERLPIALPDELKKITAVFTQDWERLAGGLKNLGTAGLVTGLSKDGGLPTRAFRQGSFEKADDISGQRLRDTVLTDRHNCWACPINCKRVVTVTGKYKADPVLGGPEYETIAALGSLCAVSDLEAICQANATCNAMGMDTISTGVLVAFTMECWERGILGRGNGTVPEVRFGDADGMIRLVEMIANREGFGDVLAEGVVRAAATVGGGAEEIALHVRGQELPMHEPRLKMGLGLGYAVSPTGADHCHNLHDTAFATPGQMLTNHNPLGILEPLAVNTLGPEKVRLYRYVAGWRHFMDCAVICHFVPWTPTQVVGLVRAVTGWDTSLLELLTVSDRSITMARCYNIREGLGGEHDQLPARMFEPIEDCSIAGRKIDREKFAQALQDLYGMYGWDEQGRPTRACLAQLDIRWAGPAAGLS